MRHLTKMDKMESRVEEIVERQKKTHYMILFTSTIKELKITKSKIRNKTPDVESKVEEVVDNLASL